MSDALNLMYKVAGLLDDGRPSQASCFLGMAIGRLEAEKVEADPEKFDAGASIRCLKAYLRLDDETQMVVRRTLETVLSPSVDADDKAMATHTIEELLFPAPVGKDGLPVDDEWDGYTEEEIRAALLRNKWHPEAVNDALKHIKEGR